MSEQVVSLAVAPQRWCLLLTVVIILLFRKHTNGDQLRDSSVQLYGNDIRVQCTTEEGVKCYHGALPEGHMVITSREDVHGQGRLKHQGAYFIPADVRPAGPWVPLLHIIDCSILSHHSVFRCLICYRTWGSCVGRGAPLELTSRTSVMR